MTGTAAARDSTNNSGNGEATCSQPRGVLSAGGVATAPGAREASWGARGGGVIDGGAEDGEFTAFVRARGQALTRTAFLLTGDAGRAEDLVQSSLLALWLRHGRVARPAWENYVRRSVVNTSVSWWRRRSSSERPTDSPPETGMADPAGTVDERRRLIAALRLLPPRQRAAVVLRFYEDFSEAETARMLGCTIGNVKSLTSRGLDRLRLVLGAVDTPSGRTGAQRLAGRNDA